MRGGNDGRSIKLEKNNPPIGKNRKKKGTRRSKVCYLKVKETVLLIPWKPLGQLALIFSRLEQQAESACSVSSVLTKTRGLIDEYRHMVAQKKGTERSSTSKKHKKKKRNPPSYWGGRK